MKHALILVWVCSAGLALAAPALGRARSSSAPAASQPLKLPPFTKAVTKNGMTLILMEQHELPLVSFSFIVRAGSAAEPAGRDGTASLVAEMLRKGTKGRTAEQFSGQLDFIGGQFDASAGRDYTAGSAEFMAKDLERGLDLLADALTRAVFPQEEVDKLLAQRLDEIKSAKDQAQGVAADYFQSYLFGSHPYGRALSGTETSVAAIKRADLVAFYEAWYAPGNTILAAAGDFRADDMVRLVESKFGAWPARRVAPPKVAAPAPVRGRKLLLVDKPDATQTVFVIGNVGISRADPDRVAVNIVNTLFGGRFTSMLNSELRIKNGLTYGASSSFDRGAVPGAFRIYSYTRNATTERALDLALEVVGRLHGKGITEEELASAKNYVKGQYPPRIETTNQLAGLLCDLELHSLGPDEVTSLFERIDAVTLDDARRVIARRFPKDDLVFVLIGKAEEIKGAAAKYAPKVDARKISDPGF